MTLTASAHAVPGTLRQEIVIDGRHRLVTDKEGAGPSPHELLPAGLAGCVASTLALYARTKGWELGELAVDVRYDTESRPREVEITIKLGGDLSAEQVERLEKVARSCPLRRSLEAGFAFSERIEAPVTGGVS